MLQPWQREQFPMSGMTPEFVAELLGSVGVAVRDEVPVVEPLAGGVSSDIVRVTVRAGTYCVKQALPKLKVEKDWLVPTDRVFAEVAWLQTANRIVPGHAPKVLGVDRDAGAFVMEYLGSESHENWKSVLASGVVDVDAGRQIAFVLGRLHAATAFDEQAKKQFANQRNFYLLRLEPYFVEAAAQNPDLAAELTRIVQSVEQNQVALVHGDASPKNVLLGPEGTMLLDAECACFSDPAFDIAFLLNHVLLKTALIPAHQAELLRMFKEVCVEYLHHVNWEPKNEVASRIAQLLPGLLLARVDGKSPVEYLSAQQAKTVRKFARSLLRCPAITLDKIVETWSETDLN